MHVHFLDVCSPHKAVDGWGPPSYCLEGIATLSRIRLSNGIYFSSYMVCGRSDSVSFVSHKYKSGYSSSFLPTIIALCVFIEFFHEIYLVRRLHMRISVTDTTTK